MQNYKTDGTFKRRGRVDLKVVIGGGLLLLFFLFPIEWQFVS